MTGTTDANSSFRSDESDHIRRQHTALDGQHVWKVRILQQYIQLIIHMFTYIHWCTFMNALHTVLN